MFQGIEVHTSITDWHMKLVQDLIEEGKDGLLRKLAKNALEKKKDTHDLDLERDLIGIVIKFLTENNQKLAIRTEGTPTSTVEVPTPTFIQMPLSFL